MITYRNNLDMTPGGIPPVIHLNQYDDDFQLIFDLYTSIGQFTIQTGTTAEIRGTKGDNNGYTASATISNNTVTVTGHKQMTAVAGRNVFELVLTKSSKDLSTVNFILDVERAAMDADTIQSETVLRELNAIIAGATTATEAASAAAASAAAAAESARTLTIDNTLTQSGQAADAKKTGDEISDLKSDLSYREQITNGDDLNNYVTTGNYYYNVNRTISNLPEKAMNGSVSKATGHLNVALNGSGLVTQKILLVSTAEIFTRVRFANGTWTAWKGDYLRYDVTQNLTAEEKATAQTNIGINTTSLKMAVFNQTINTEIRQRLMAKNNIGIDTSGNVEVFEKQLNPNLVALEKLYQCSNNVATPIDVVEGAYKRYSVSAGKTYYISGRHLYTDRPLYILLNSSGGVVSYFDGGDKGHDVYNYELTVPSNATTLIVNGNRVDHKQINVTQTPELAQDTVYDGLIALRSGSTTQYEILSSETYAKCVRYAISPRQEYCLIGGCHYYTDRPLYMITDASGNVLKYYNGGTSGHDSEIWCFGTPANSAYLYVNVAQAFIDTVKLYATGTYYTLNAYVNKKIKDFVSEFVGVVGVIYTPQMFGAKANGSSNDTVAIQAAIEAAKGGTVFFPAGTYSIASPIQTYKHNTNYTNLIFAEDAKVVASQSMPYLLNLGVLGNDTRVGHVRKVLRGGTFDGSNGNVTTAIVHISAGCMTLDMSDFQIIANNCDGIHVGDSGSPSSIDANIHNGFIKKSDISVSTGSGIKLFGTDNNLSDLRVYYFNKNIEVVADGQFFTDIHTLSASNSVGDTSLYIHDGMHITCYDFYGDSEDTFIYLGDGSTLVATNLYYYSYRTNSVTVFDVHGQPRIIVCGFHLNIKDYNYIGLKMNGGNLANVLSKGNFVVAGMDIEFAPYLKNGDPLKNAMSKDAQPLFANTSLQANKWYYVCSYPADSSTKHWFEMYDGIKRTQIPVSVEYSNGLTDEALLSTVETNDSKVFDVGFSLSDTASGYALINVYIKPTAAMGMSEFNVISKQDVGGSTNAQSVNEQLSFVSVTPAVVYRIDCANKTVTKQ